jgi:hypothetical protein
MKFVLRIFDFQKSKITLLKISIKLRLEQGWLKGVFLI